MITLLCVVVGILILPTLIDTIAAALLLVVAGAYWLVREVLIYGIVACAAALVIAITFASIRGMFT